MSSALIIVVATIGLLLLAGGVAALVISGRRKNIPTELPADTTEAPEVPSGRLVRLRSRLAGSQSPLGRGLLAILGRDRIDDAAWQELEDTLLAADLGVGPTAELVDALRKKVRVDGLTAPTPSR